jgi:hypothetical protein
MKNRIITTFCLSILLLTSSVSIAHDKKIVETCSSSKEFITTINYLKQKKEFSLDDKDAFETAMKVSKGCSYSSSRFINALELLLKISLTTSDAIKVAIRVAHSDDAKSEAFEDVLKRSFTKKYLDLPLKDSVDYAIALSIDFKGDPTVARNDFKRLVEFCKDEDYLEMPIIKCAAIALEVSKHTVKFKKSLVSSFIDLFEFQIDKDGPNLPTFNALEITREVIAAGPLAEENFKLAYKYATRKDPGLNYDRTNAVKFAKKMALLSYRMKKEKK